MAEFVINVGARGQRIVTEHILQIFKLGALCERLGIESPEIRTNGMLIGYIALTIEDETKAAVFKLACDIPMVPIPEYNQMVEDERLQYAAVKPRPSIRSVLKDMCRWYWDGVCSLVRWIGQKLAPP